MGQGHPHQQLIEIQMEWISKYAEFPLFCDIEIHCTKPFNPLTGVNIVCIGCTYSYSSFSCNGHPKASENRGECWQQL